MVKLRKKRCFFRPYQKIMFSQYATRKTSPICKISTFSEDLSFLNPRSHLVITAGLDQSPDYFLIITFINMSLLSEPASIKHVALQHAHCFHFVLLILFVLTLTFDRPVLYQNVAFSVIVLSTKKQCFSFLKKVLVFQKTYFKVKVLKTFKISSNRHLKTCRSLKRRSILKIPNPLFQRNLRSFC